MKKTITVRLTATLDDALSHYADQQGLTITDVVTRALEGFLGLNTPAPPAPPAPPEYLENIERRLVELEARTVATVPTSDPEVLERLEQLEHRLGELAQRLEAPSRTKSTATPRQKPTENPLTFVDSDNSAMVPDLSKGLTGAQLSQRFGMNPNSANGEWGRKKANPPDFHRWSRGRDPEGKAWTRAEDGRYYPHT